LNATATQAVLFFVALTGAWLLRFFWGLWLECLAFWATRADALLALQDAMIFLLAGVVAPVAVLPPLLQIIARVLPFYYMVGFPVEVLTGQITGVEVTTGFMIQAAWLLVAVLIYRFVWRSGLKRYSAIGG
jgi:ABC-2 type transport system permease protein